MGGCIEGVARVSDRGKSGRVAVGDGGAAWYGKLKNDIRFIGSHRQISAVFYVRTAKTVFGEPVRLNTFQFRRGGT